MRTGDVGGEVGQVLAGLTAVNTLDVTGLPDAQVRAEVLALIAAHNQLAAALAARVDSFDIRDLARSDGQGATSTWLMNFGRMSKGAGLRWVARGRWLRHLPAVAAGMRAGLISVEQLAAIGELVKRVGIGKVTEFDEILAALCTSTGPREVAQACERIYAWLDPDGPAPDGDEDGAGRRELTFAQVGRSLYLRGRLDAEGAAIVQTAIDALMRPPGPGDDRTAAQRRADALVDLARTALAAGTVPEVGGERPHVAILITPEILFGNPTAEPGSEGHPEPAGDGGQQADSSTRAQPQDRADTSESAQHASAREADPVPAAPSHDDDPLTAAGVPELPVRPWLSWVGEVSTALAQRLACDGIIWRLILDPRNGLPLDVGDKYRIAPPWIRKALWARDRTCRWPGCDVPAQWTDAHHIVPWWKQHRTDVAGMISLCRNHHGLVHEGQWMIHFDHATGEVAVTRPDGSSYELAPSKPWTTPSHQGPGPQPRPRETTDPPWPAAA